MKITALEEYGLRCVLRLAMAQDGGPLTVAEIASSEGLTVPYVGKLMSVLRQSGLVESVRGRGGGYVLTRPAHQISAEEVLHVLGEPLFTATYCQSHPGILDVCTHQGNCSIRSVWQVLGEMIHQVLRKTSLADLCQQEAQLTKRLEDGYQITLLGLGASGSGPVGSGAAPAKLRE
ncbi:MAG: transcriptional regulator [Acidobacteria bacterium]|nr:MAG: transcriptional regulator [Acidobacteriota bacterium]